MRFRLRRWTASLLLMILLWAPFKGLAIQEISDEAVDSIFKKSQAVGASVVIYKDGQLVYARDYGFKDVKRKLPVDEKTYFKLGCVTKAVTAIGVMQLVEQGKLDLDEDISTYFGYPIANGYFKNIPLTLRQMMSHTSSVREEGGYSNLKSTVEGMLSAKVDRRGNYQQYEPGSRYMYSNFGSGIVGSCIEAVSGMSVNGFIKQAVFDKLNVSAAYSASLLPDPENVASIYLKGQLHRSAKGYINEVYDDTSNPEAHYRTTVGSMWIRSRDLAKYMVALCGDGTVDGVRLLSENSLMMMRADQKTLNKSVTGDSNYGLFLERNKTLIEGKTFYGHQGMLKGAFLNTYFDPETQFVFVILCNGCSMSRSDYVSAMARNMLKYTYPIFTQE